MDQGRLFFLSLSIILVNRCQSFQKSTSYYKHNYEYESICFMQNKKTLLRMKHMHSTKAVVVCTVYAKTPGSPYTCNTF